MATVRTVKRKKGTVYRAEVRIKGHPRFSQTFDRKSEAQRWAEDTETDLRNGAYVGNAPATICCLMMRWKNIWMKYPVKKPSLPTGAKFISQNPFITSLAKP